MEKETNWLHMEELECPVCREKLYRVDHSPFYDEHFLYCDHCPIRVEVRFYDPVYQHLVQQVVPNESRKYPALMRTLEFHLKPCV